VDTATGLANRRYLDLFLDREVGRAQRLDKPLCIAVFNIDGFRHLDDGAAQTAMLELGKRLAAGIREYDIAARHSDGRVVLVLPEATLEAALEVVERLRTAASQAVVEGKPLVVSVGLAAFSKHGDSAEELINAAHHALNRGRSETSDRVHLPEDLAKAS
jgi:diguanylate cyclase (GGDEF)-like protein